MYLQRKLDSRLQQWAGSVHRKPLILRGARQVGKTETIRNFGRRFSSFVHVNLEKYSRLGRVFDGDLEPKRIVRELETLLSAEIIPGKALLFLDEIQACPRAITALRYFFEELPQLHVIAAGSLLEFALGTYSVPVGRVSYEYLYPLSFSEYLEAVGQFRLITHIPILNQSQSPPFSSAIHALLREKLREYFIVGGMPEAVLNFVDRGSFAQVHKIHDDILETYKDDMHKYAKGERQLSSCTEVFSRLFKFVGKTITYTHVAQGDSSQRAKKSILLFKQALVIHQVSSVQPAGLPLGAEASSSQFKCVFLDIGLGNRSAGYNPSEILVASNLLQIYEGRLAEQFVGQQLISESTTASEGRNLYCWIRQEKSSSAEVDYVIVRDGKIIPIEVKSGKSGRLRSLHLFLEKFGGKGICLQDTEQVTDTGLITFMPLYSIL